MSKALITATWDDVPHLTPEMKEELLSSYPEHERDARTKGVPQLGSGLIYPVPDELVMCDPFPIPAFWPRLAAMDFGWDHPTTVVWGAIDRDTDTTYVYSEYAASKTVVAVHADAIKARGQWIPVAWPHDGNNDTAAGPGLASQYRDKGVNMMPERAQFTDDTMDEETKNVKASVEAGIQSILTAFNEGRLKIFSTCGGILAEKRWYRRDKGKIVKVQDDLLDALRYLWMTREFARVRPSERSTRRHSGESWKTA